MKYMKNSSMDFLEIDDEILAVYDPDSENTYYISGTGKAILSLIDGKVNLSELIDKLCEIYSADKCEVERDVTEYVKELERKEVITAHEN